MSFEEPGTIDEKMQQPPLPQITSCDGFYAYFFPCVRKRQEDESP